MKKTIFTNGCFDVIHRGHFELLKYCKSLGYVIVGLNGDDSIKRLKGEHRPFFSQQDRRFMLESCRFVDDVVIFDEDTPYNLIKLLQPDIIVKLWVMIYVKLRFSIILTDTPLQKF